MHRERSFDVEVCRPQGVEGALGRLGRPCEINLKCFSVQATYVLGHESKQPLK